MCAISWQNPKCGEGNISHDPTLLYDVTQRCLLSLLWLTDPWRQQLQTVFKLSFHTEIKLLYKATHRHRRGKNTHTLYLEAYESAGRTTVNFTASQSLSSFTVTTSVCAFTLYFDLRAGEALHPGPSRIILASGEKCYCYCFIHWWNVGKN